MKRSEETLYRHADALRSALPPIGTRLPDPSGRPRRSRRRARALVAAVILAAALCLGTVSAAGLSGLSLGSLVDMILRSGRDLEPAVLESEIKNGQWIYLNGDNVAVIVPEAPVRVLLSGDGGSSWRSVTITGSGAMESLGEWVTDMAYYGGYIGFDQADGRFGYLVLTTGAAMNHQDLRIYLTEDGGDTWREIGTPYDQHISVLTGAGFASEEVGFISYRYYEDAGPDIWWTQDGGDTWARLELELPDGYQDCRFTPLSPAFAGPEGSYPIQVVHPSGETSTLTMYTHDGGLTWSFDPS